MIAYLNGMLAGKGLDSIIVEVGGIGYRVLLSSRSIARLGNVGDRVMVITHLQVRDDGLTLYGFTHQEEKDLFMRLTAVSSVGPKVALSVLSTYDPAEVASAIAAEDLAAIQRVPGIGKKMAQRIVLELKESFGDELQAVLSGQSKKALNAKKGALEALLSMGFTSEESELALKGAPDEASETILLQYALKRLAN